MRLAVLRSAAVLAATIGFLGGAAFLSAQVAMPDPKEMSGIPRPVTDLPSGSISVRVIRGELTNNISDQPVELTVDGKVRTAKTDAEGRAQFDKLPAGAQVKAVTVVDGERLESQLFPAPASGGIRLMLVATDKEKEARKAEAASKPAVAGTVVLGGETRIHIEPGDEKVDIYYILDIVNNASTPVTTAALFAFDMPEGAAGTTLFQGSSPLAGVTGTHVRVTGPFPPGKTSLQVACTLPVLRGAMNIDIKLPAPWEQPLVVMKKFGATKLASTQFIGQQDMPERGAIMAGANRLEPGQVLTLNLTDLPHHSPAPRWIALGLAAFVALAGVIAWMRPVDKKSALKGERKRLVARREKLLQELVRLENDHRAGKGDRARYEARREDLVASLERVYGALETDGPGAGPDRTGVAA